MILAKFPEFANSIRWKEHLKFWEGEEPPFSIEMSEFSSFIADSLNNNDSNINFHEVFSFIENLIAQGEQEVKDAATTCFLENLLNYDSAGRIKASSFIHLLGPRSKEYCKTWDEFTDVKTPGLWDK